MSTDRPSSRPPLATGTVTHLLDLGRTGPARPVDVLIDRLATDRESHWLRQTLRTVCEGDDDPATVGTIPCVLIFRTRFPYVSEK